MTEQAPNGHHRRRYGQPTQHGNSTFTSVQFIAGVLWEQSGCLYSCNANSEWAVSVCFVPRNGGPYLTDLKQLTRDWEVDQRGLEWVCGSNVVNMV